MRTIPRYYTSASGVEDNTIAQTVRKTKELINQISDSSRIVLLSKSRNKEGRLSLLFRDTLLKRFRRYAKSSDFNGPVQFESPDSYHPLAGEILITVDLDSDEVLLLEDNTSIKAIIALPRLKYSINKWARITSAINMDTETRAAPFAHSACVVIRALETLTNSIDVSEGLSHSSDERLAKTYLRACQKYEVPLQEAEIEAYLLKELHWKKVHANDLLAIIQKINNGESFEGGGRTKLYYHIQRWEEECIDNK